MGGASKTLVMLGVALVAVGGVFILVGAVAGRVPLLGRLPGDIHIEREGWSFHVPLASSLLVSVVLTMVLTWLFRR